jgi:hypothetical protein
VDAIQGSETAGDRPATAPPPPEEPREKPDLDEAIARAIAAAGLPETGMPPRSVIHPSQYAKITKWFYRSLVALFAALVAGLLWWGYEQYGGRW